MYSIATYITAAGVGVLIALFLTRTPEMRGARLWQIFLLPGVLLLILWILAQTQGQPDAVARTAIVIIIALTGIFLAPTVAFNCSHGLSNFLDPSDWTPAQEEIALRPIRRLIDAEEYFEAITDLEVLLKKHEPTYEAQLIHAKLLHHFGRLNETAASLLECIELSHTTAQQMYVMELLAELENRASGPPPPVSRGTRTVRIKHELILFQPNTSNRAVHKIIPPGAYEVKETLHRRIRWLKLAGENWGNAEACWEAIEETKAWASPAHSQPKRSRWPFGRKTDGMTTTTFRRDRSRLQLRAEADKLLRDANQQIRQGNWPAARPLLQKAATLDPHRYEIAYRWVLAVRQTDDDSTTVRAVKKVLRQEEWSADEREMLHRLQHPSARRE